MSESANLLGLMSGTSTDGIDAALVRLSESAGRSDIDLIAFNTQPYTPRMCQRLLELASGDGAPPEIARTNFLLGDLFADAAESVIQASGLAPVQITAIGCSGHTISHLPAPASDGLPAATMQIGEPAVVTERTGITVVSDFRVRDLAAGGQGAPLAAYFDFQFLRSDAVSRAVLNIGGIANVTILLAGCAIDDVVAFDTGPGNMPIDVAVSALFPQGDGYDRDGAMARRGNVHQDLVDAILSEDYFTRPPPKSCGREQFGQEFVQAVITQRPHLPPEDIIATLTNISARTAADAIAQFRASKAGPWELLVCGGGAHNSYLIEQISQYAEMPVKPTSTCGIPVDAKEAMLFAYLAWETMRGRPSNVAAATGAKGPRVLGKITPP